MRGFRPVRFLNMGTLTTTTQRKIRGAFFALFRTFGTLGAVKNL